MLHEYKYLLGMFSQKKHCICKCCCWYNVLSRAEIALATSVSPIEVWYTHSYTCASYVIR